MNKLIMRTTTLLVGALACFLSGCVSPLRSSNPATRKRAVEEISDQKGLFFIAMNIDIEVERWWRKKPRVHLRPAQYHDDVRLMAVQKISDPKYLVKCAIFSDNDVYINDHGLPSEPRRFGFKGGTMYKPGMTEIRVAAGDAVRSAATESLAKPEIFRTLSKVYENPNDYYSVTQLFPARHIPYRYRRSSSFYDEYNLTFCDLHGNVRPNNPFNQLIEKVAEKQSSEDVIAVLTSCSEWLPLIAPFAYDQCLKNKLDGITDAKARSLYRELFSNGGDMCPSMSYYQRLSIENVGDMMKSWSWLIYQHIDNPNLEIVQSALKNSDSKLFDGILSKVTNPKVLAAIEDGKHWIGKPWGWSIDLKPAVAAHILEKFNNQQDLAYLAKSAKIEMIRAAAIAKLNDDEVLVEIASKSDESNNLREAAINRIKDVKALRVIRKNASKVNLKTAATLRLAALEVSDVDEICAYETYDIDLFSMLAEIKKSTDIANIVKNAKLKGVRMIAASRLSQTEYETVARKESVDDGKCAAGKVDIGGFYLGMNIETAYAMIVAKYPSVKPTMYLDGTVLCLADANGQDLAWANERTREIHWLTLTPAIVKGIAGFTSGSFDDLENAVEHTLNVSFGSDIVRNGEVSQNIGNLETTEGETLRFFRSDLTKGEDRSRSARKALYKYVTDTDPLNINAGIQVAFANEYENAMQAGENNRNAKSPRFAPRGSLQLQLTRNAIKGSRGATGRWR